jgi:CBS domain-containing protein
MARYERDYGREFGRWRQQGPQQIGGMRSDGWGGSGDWRNFPGEEGWYGEGYEGMPNFGYDAGFQGGEGSGQQRGPGWMGRGSSNRFGGRQNNEFQGGGGYGGEFRPRGGAYGGRGWDSGYTGRDTSEGWDESRGGNRNRLTQGGQSDHLRTRAAEIMTENPHAVTPDATLSEVAQKMRDLDVGIIPVIDGKENRRLRGVITDRDIAVRAVAEGKDGNAKVSDCMTGSVRSVNKNDSIRDVMRVMQQEQVRRVPVTDREGRLVGIIAQADLAVDYANDDQQREHELGETLERISEPAEPQSRGGRMSASNRGSKQESTEQGGTKRGRNTGTQKE